ncbi:MAG: 7TM diverse intracellular signaling domain-containing protein [Oligoflexus sp.]
MLRLIFIYLSLIISAKSLLAREAFPIQEQHNGEALGQYMLVYEDHEQYPVEKLIDHLDKFSRSLHDYPNFKITTAKTWAWISFNNPFPEDRTILIENDYSMTDEIALYAFEKNQAQFIMSLGDHQALVERSLYYRNAVFPLTLKPGMQSFLISVKTEGPNKMPLKIWTETALEKKMTQENFYLGSGFGFIALMTLYNAFVCVSLRSRSYLYYVLYSLSMLFLINALMGLSGYLVADKSLQIWLSNWGFLMGVINCNIFALLFTIRFLDLKNQLPILHKIFLVFCGINFLVLCAIIAQINYFHLARIANAFTGIATLSMIGVGCYFVWQRYRPAYFYTLAWSFILGSALSLTLSNLAIIPTNFWTTYGVFFGACCEMVLLSFALADRVRLLRENHERNKDLYYKNLLNKDQEIQHSYGQLAKIVYPHQIHMMKTGLNLEDTMPVGKSKATVIVFDIIASAKIRASNKQDFFQEVFATCYRHMMQEYHQEEYRGGAYRLKELGDGFICSVGFPFLLPQQEKRNEFAVALALDFVKIFHELSHKMLAEEACYCSIGIAEGHVSGFYPASGVREYDLYGEAIVLASRYESLRRVMFPEADESIIIAQVSVMQDLERSMTEKFARLSLSNTKVLRIRDDPFADAVYVGKFDRAKAQEAASELPIAK